MVKFLALLLLVPALATCLRDSDVTEKNLHQVIFNLDMKPPGLDLNWMGSIDKWYVPSWSRLHSYRTAQGVLQKDDVSEAELRSSCLEFHQDGSVHAFGKASSFEVETGPVFLDFATPWKKIKARYSYRLTDNKSFILGIAIWQDGQLSYAVLSTTPTLKDQANYKIMHYLKTLGLDNKSSVENNYENCKGSRTNSEL